MNSLRSMLTVLALTVGSLAMAGDAPAPATAEAPPAKCEHGVKKTICTRCNSKLEAVFKKKGDWCAEHKRPESQCVKCNPELAKDGVK